MASGQKTKQKQSERHRPRNFRDYTRPVANRGARTEEQARFDYLASGWHPLLQVNVTELENGWKQVIGIDGVTHQRCSIITKGSFQNWAPTFLKVEKPERLKCELQQAVVFADDEFSAMKAAGWFGAYSLEEARISKRASEGEAGAMYRAAELRSFRFLRSEDSLPHIERWVDIEAARHWFKRSAQSGFVPAVLGEAYLEDLIEFGEKVYPRLDKRDFLEATIEGILELQSEIARAKAECDEDSLEWEFEAAFEWFGYSFEEWEDRKNVAHLAGVVKKFIAKWKKDLGIEASS